MCRGQGLATAPWMVTLQQLSVDFGKMTLTDLVSVSWAGLGRIILRICQDRLYIARITLHESQMQQCLHFLIILNTINSRSEPSMWQGEQEAGNNWLGLMRTEKRPLSLDSGASAILILYEVLAFHRDTAKVGSSDICLAGIIWNSHGLRSKTLLDSCYLGTVTIYGFPEES